MHSGPVPGTFEGPGEIINDWPCKKCRSTEVRMETWDSSDGAYTDYHFTCQNPACGHSWWEEGADT